MTQHLQNQLKLIVKSHITPLLAEVGFRKNGFVYIKELADVAWLIDIQQSRWGGGDTIQCTLNCGVYVPNVMSVYANMREPISPKIVNCCIGARVGMLKPEHLDIWWAISNQDDTPTNQKTGIEIAANIRDIILPFLHQFDGRIHVADFLAQTDSNWPKYVSPSNVAQRRAYASIIYSYAGCKDKALETYGLALCDAADSPIEEIIDNLKYKIFKTTGDTVFE